MLKPSSTLRVAQKWSKTLKLPRSTFPWRPLEQARPRYLKECSDDLYAAQAARPGDADFVLHDGPPYANGSLHIGHALNKILKDIICRFHISQGRKVHYVPGFDCHGLPIETKALQGHATFRKTPVPEIRLRARKLASTSVGLQKKAFKQWAVLGDWDNAYQTMDQSYILRQLRIFQAMAKQGLIYRQNKPVHWSPVSGTALAEAELEYDDKHVSLAAYIKFRISNLPPLLQSQLPTERPRVYALIWTTTPWTIPANRAIGVNEQVKYCIFRINNTEDFYLVGQSLLEEIFTRGEIPGEHISIISRDIPGGSLIGNGGATYINPFSSESHRPFLSADFVSDTSGTGIVHMAPGHGFDDYSICRSHNIDAFSPVDGEGRFTGDVYQEQPELLMGKEVLKEGSIAVLDWLSSAKYLKNGSVENLVWATHEYSHSYPIDWRTKTPVIVRATPQWFADISSIKEKALGALKKVRFIPDTGRARLESFVSGRSEWCVSRGRSWGVPIPALYASNGHAVMDDSTIEHIVKVIEERGINAWFTDEADDSAWIPQHLPPDEYTRGRETMDVWFDSGTSWTQLQTRPSLPPADLYLEGTDQHRGWFQSSLLTYIAHQTTLSSELEQWKAPYGTLITHGFTLDSSGRKMSKSENNVVLPEEIMSGALLTPKKSSGKGRKADPKSSDAMGPDALRLWVASSDYTRDISIGTPILDAVNTNLHKYRITFKWLLGALEDYDATKVEDTASFVEGYRLADQIGLAQLHDSEAKVHAAYADNDFAKAINLINTYINSDLSAFYFETAKDLLYTGGFLDRLRVQAVCCEILAALMKMLGPVLPLLVTEVYDHASETLKRNLSDTFITGPWAPEHCSPSKSPRMELPEPSRIRNLFEIHGAIKTAQEVARADKKLGSGLECHVVLETSSNMLPATYEFLRKACDKGDLADVFVISSASVVPAALGSSLRPGQSVESRPNDWSYKASVALSTPGDGQATAGTVSVSVQPPLGRKCPRCWRSVVQPSKESHDEPSICDRCSDALSENGVAKV